jgi:hypothetical protein
MIKHIVLWKLTEGAGGRSKAENAARIRAALEGLRGRIPGLLKIEVGFDVLHGETSSDVALYSEMASREVLDSYQSHPEHQAVVPLMRELTSERRSVDYEA